MPEEQLPTHEVLFRENKICVLIPTYNNAGSLADVVKNVLAYTTQVIVVNDGSTDNTAEILRNFKNIHVVSYLPNKGKGIALRTGIREAAKLGYDYAIAIDSDGQHYAHDLPRFLEQILETPGALIVGARNLNQENVPGKSSFGNRFSNFWYWIETGIRLPDTQSGYRLYPVAKLAKKKYITRKYEFEIEVMVRAAWSGILVVTIPISVYYPPAEERVSHFRPFKDFTRISILNTVLVLIAFLWIKPRDFVKLMFSREGWRKIWNAIFVNPQESNNTKAASIGFGIFMGIVPVWGFQLAIGIPLAMLFKLNKTLFILAANISIFPFTVFILMASLITGKLVLGDTHWLDVHAMTLERFKHAGVAFFLGGTVLAIVAGLAAYLITLLSLAMLRRRKRVSNADQ